MESRDPGCLAAPGDGHVVIVLRSALAMGVIAVLVGCGATSVPADKPHTRPSATMPPSAAARALAALQSSVADLGAVEVSGGAPGALGDGQISGAADLRTGEFHVTVELDDGTGVLRMIRQNDLAWTKAPPRFWTELGYTADSARRAQNRWVVARVEAIKPLVESLDPGASVRALLQIDPGDAISVAKVREGDLRGHRVLRLRQGGNEQSVYLTTGARPRLLRISSSSGARTTTVNFTAFPERLRVRLPHAADVLPPS